MHNDSGFQPNHSDPHAEKSLHAWFNFLCDRTLWLLPLIVVATWILLQHLAQLSGDLYRGLALQGTGLQSKTIEEFRQLYSSEVAERVRDYGIEVRHDFQDHDRAIPLPDTLMMEIGKRLDAGRPGAHIRLFSNHPFPSRSSRILDDFEQAALVALRENPNQPYWKFVDYQGRPSLRFATSDIMTARCVACHNSHPDSPKSDWKVGDVRGVMEVIRPLDGDVALAQADLQCTLDLIIGAYALGAMGLGLVILKLRRSTKQLRDAEVRTRAVVEHLEASQQRLQAIIDTVDGIVWEADAETFQFTFVSQKAERILGYPVEQWISDPAFWTNHLYPEDRLWAMEFCVNATRELRSHEFEYRMLAADGRVVWLNDIVTVICEPGRPTKLRGIIVDVTESKRGAETLRESEARLQVAIQASNLGPWDWNLVTDKVHFAPEWKRQLGYADDEIEGHFLEFVNRLHPDDHDRIMSCIQAYIADPRTGYDVEFRMRHKDESYRWIQTRATMQFDVSGTPVRMLGCHLDITVRKQTEGALRERARLAILEAEVGTALTLGGTLTETLRLCSEAIVRNLDAAFARIWTLNEQEEMLDLQASAGLYTHIDGPHGHVPVGKFKIGMIAAERKPHLTNQVLGDPRVGDQDWARREGMVAFAGYPLLVADRLVGVVAMFARSPFTEVTLQALASISNNIALGIDRKRAEEVLRTSEENFHLLSDNITDVFWIASHDMRRIHYVSPGYELIWGRSSASLYKHPQEWSEAILPEDIERVMAAISVHSASETSVKIEYRIARPDGAIRWIHSNGFPVRDDRGKVIRITGIASDITERKLAEEQLDELHQKLLNTSRQAGMAEIATNVLHNVGNVLNSVNVSATLVVDGIKKSKTSALSRVVDLLKQHEGDLGEFIATDSRGKHLPIYLAQLSEHILSEQRAIVNELDSLQRNISHIKEIVAMQQNYAKVSGVREIVSVVELVEDSLHMSEGALARHGIEVNREFETVPLINIDKHKVLQILVNLVRNAKLACCESERSDKRLTLRVVHRDGRIKISVIDNGIGIPPENLTRIFNHGFTTRDSGHGFGLHSGALAAKDMGGSLTATSAGTGQGACFTLELRDQTELEVQTLDESASEPIVSSSIRVANVSHWPRLLMLLATSLLTLLYSSPACALDPNKSVFQFNCQNWTRQSGLPVDKINAITQNTDGYLWLGTQNGLIRFDGHEFKIVPIDLPQAHGQNIWRLSRSETGGMWFAVHEGGFGAYDGHKFAAIGDDRWTLPGLEANVILESRDGAVWTGGDLGLGRWVRGKPLE
ncbi:MAG: sensor signal transduction histidine kinase [Planctomycetaceae bacterium]|nr:sensor signal transduction histidine kinase [Planctomycetaceae bacterium]